MRLWSDSFRDGGLIPVENTLGAIDPQAHVRLSDNRNPHLAWDDVPNGTASLALLCYDADAPLNTADVNRRGVTLAPGLLRGPFYHWSLIDIPLSPQTIAEGQFSNRVTPRGKPSAVLDGVIPPMRQGLNDYTAWFAGDPDMAGDYYGYDGPCPPWNDERIHHYIFRVYALDVLRLAVEGRFTGRQARAAMHGHILDEAQLVGAYSLYPALAFTLKK
ncbi:MAG TPA: YbhB/YbcL family Raf kinase inhibitor-like protein [Janthinobacterium sp.]|nr:YbhB/YbcL family Raf kinase inhibitor-like protein [Janthinobacterium sp.]